jgi:Tfp pilus assembly protein PilO
MANIFFLVLAIVLLLVAVFSCFLSQRQEKSGYVQKKTLITKAKQEIRIRELSRMNLTEF